jgi:hypothetical protein
MLGAWSIDTNVVNPQLLVLSSGSFESAQDGFALSPPTEEHPSIRTAAKATKRKRDT